MLKSLVFPYNLTFNTYVKIFSLYIDFFHYIKAYNYLSLVTQPCIWSFTKLLLLFFVLTESFEPNGESHEPRNKVLPQDHDSQTGKFVWHCSLVVDTWLWYQKVPGLSLCYARSTFSPRKRLFTCVSSPHSCVRRVPNYRQYTRVTCHL